MKVLLVEDDVQLTEILCQGFAEHGIHPFRKRALKRAEQWMLERFEGSDGLAAIFPAMLNSLIALKALGYADDHPQVVRAEKEVKLVFADTLYWGAVLHPHDQCRTQVIRVREALGTSPHGAWCKLRRHGEPAWTDSYRALFTRVIYTEWIFSR